jgi:hypothetical protein
VTHNDTMQEENSDGNITLGLTHLSGGDNIGTSSRQRGAARATRVKVPAWRCSECGAVMGVGDKKGQPPRRCSNRKTCGALFHNAKR